MTADDDDGIGDSTSPSSAESINRELTLKLEAVSRAYNDLQNLVAAIDVGTLFLDSSLHIKRFTQSVTELFSITPSDEGRLVTDLTHQLEYDELTNDAQAVLTRFTPIQREIRSRDDRWYDVRLRPYRTVDDKIDGVVITFVDVTERRESEKRQRLQLSELAHRVKNTLTVVQAIAAQTMRNHTGADFLDRFSGRVSALAAAHSLLVQSEWKGADLGGLARSQLEAHALENPDRVRFEGEPVLLPADLATPFGLVVHELATNAAKYGALSQPGGVINISWTLISRNDKRAVRIVWREEGGPPAERPKAGFGTSLIERGIPGATVANEFTPGGLVCTIEAPLPSSAENGVAS